MSTTQILIPPFRYCSVILQCELWAKVSLVPDSQSKKKKKKAAKTVYLTKIPSLCLINLTRIPGALPPSQMLSLPPSLLTRASGPGLWAGVGSKGWPLISNLPKLFYGISWTLRTQLWPFSTIRSQLETEQISNIEHICPKRQLPCCSASIHTFPLLSLPSRTESWVKSQAQFLLSSLLLWFRTQVLFCENSVSAILESAMPAILRSCSYWVESYRGRLLLLPLFLIIY